MYLNFVAVIVFEIDVFYVDHLLLPSTLLFPEAVLESVVVLMDKV